MWHVFCPFQIYTDWANHYLDKGKCKRHIQSLQNDVVDGVIIRDVIEAVSKYNMVVVYWWIYGIYDPSGVL